MELSPEEAELAKLFTNVWRYIKFAAANQFYMMANDRGLDFERIREGLSQDYPRAADMPGAGFAAGPCLFKDTMQLAAFANNNFALGHTAMTVNEGLPLYLVPGWSSALTWGADGRDPRDGVQGRIRRHPHQPVLQAQAGAGIQGRRASCAPTLTSRPTPACCPQDEVIAKADLLVIAAPHPQYRDLDIDQARRRHLERPRPRRPGLTSGEHQVVPRRRAARP